MDKQLSSYVGKDDHATPLLKDLYWLNINLNKELLTPYCLARMLHSSTLHLARADYNMKSYGAPDLWNQLPDDIRLTI